MKYSETVLMTVHVHMYPGYLSDFTMDNNVTGSVTSTLSNSIDDQVVEADTIVKSDIAVHLPNSSE